MGNDESRMKEDIDMNEMEKKVVIEGESFEKMRADANTVLQKLLKNMVEKNTLEGKLQINIDISLVPSYVPIPPEQQTPESRETRRMLNPKINHKISSTMQIKDDCKGAYENDMFEIVWDDDVKAYVMKPVTGWQQMNIYDMMNENVSTGAPENSGEQKTVSGRKFTALPAPEDPSCQSDEEDDVVDGEFREVPPEDDISESDDDSDEDSDDDDIGGYEYQDPDDEEEEEE